MVRGRLAPACMCIALAHAGVALATQAEDCLQLVTRPGADAQFTNVCIDPVNVMYCFEGGAVAPACADHPQDVITLSAGDTFLLAGYDGRNVRLRRAVCPYPEAPHGWQPGSEQAYGCKKTCVMC